MIYEEKQLPELYNMKHRHDGDTEFMDYENNILNKSLSPYIFNNDLMNNFLNRVKKMVSILFDQHNVVKNFKNYMVDKDYFKNKN